VTWVLPFVTFRTRTRYFDASRYTCACKFGVTRFLFTHSFLKKHPAFAERLKRAEHNIANRKKRRGAAPVPTKAFTDASPYHQRLAQFEAWRTGDPYLPPAAVNHCPCGDENNKQLVKDLHEVRGDLIGKKLMELLRGAEGSHEEEGETVNVFDPHAATSETASLEAAASQLHSTALRLRAESEDSSVIAPVDSHMEGDEPLLAIADASQLDSNLQTSENTSVTEDSSTVVTVSVDERNLSEYEAKLHRYSSKVRMEITERLRKPEGSCYFVFVREGNCIQD
jgi:hypothetical protein